MSDPYTVLGLAPDADEGEIEAAYGRQRAQIVSHYAAADDLSEQAADLDSQLKALDDAYATLKPPQGARAATTLPAIREDRSLGQVAGRICPVCGATNPEQALACLNCGKQFSRSCPRCRWPVSVDAQACGRCGAVIKEYDQRLFQQAAVVEQRTTQERQISELRVGKLEEYHRARAWHGAIFWVVSFFLFWGVVLLVVVLAAYGNR